MIKVEAIKDFNFKDIDKIVNLKRKSLEKKNYIYKGDTFECTKQMVDYLTGKNDAGAIVIKILEVAPKKKTSKK